jgi:hypothetical protein
MKELTRTDYMYIIIIILLLASLVWIVLPFTYTAFNGNIDTPDCITDTDSIVCIQDGNFKSCEYNCTRINGTIEKRHMAGGT